MNIYFSCSITGGRNDEQVYLLLVKEMERQGHCVLTAHLASPEVMNLEKVAEPKEIFERDMDWLRNCDAVVAEVSTPSHGVGYEIAVGLQLKKPVFCCYRCGKKVSKILTGNSSRDLQVNSYKDEVEAVVNLKKFLQQVKH